MNWLDSKTVKIIFENKQSSDGIILQCRIDERVFSNLIFDQASVDEVNLGPYLFPFGSPFPLLHIKFSNTILSFQLNQMD